MILHVVVNPVLTVQRVLTNIMVDSNVSVEQDGEEHYVKCKKTQILANPIHVSKEKPV